MKSYRIILFLSLFVLSFAAKREYFFPVPKGWTKPAYDFSHNPLTEKKIELGRVLFYDPILSRDNSVSCSSCHLSHTAFTHIDHDLSHGIDGRVGKRNSPALMNLAWSPFFMWDGSVVRLDEQAIRPINHPDEMDETLPNVLAKLQKSAAYPRLFEGAFGDSAVTEQRLLKALSQFMLTLVSANSKYDKVMRREPGVAFNEYEKKGYTLFQTFCSSCHREPLFTNNSFENNGLPLDTALRDIGRMAITRQKGDSLKFKVPTLRNVEVSYPYMHDGRFKSLQMILFHYTEGVTSSSTLSKELATKIILSEEDKRNIIAFLKTLTDEEFLRNPKFQYRKP